MKKNAQTPPKRQNMALWLPNDVWFRQIFSRVSHKEASVFSESCFYSHEVFIAYIQDMFRYTKFDAAKVFQRAYREGVKLNIPLLSRLCNTHKSGDLFDRLQMETNPSWCIAAICGDIDWLVGKYKKKYTEVMTESIRRQVGMLFFVTLGGHLEIIKKDFTLILEEYNRTRDTLWIREINYVAGRLGHFHICDHLEKQFNVQPDRKFQDGESTIDFYARFGETERLTRALEKMSSVSKSYLVHLVHEACKGGHIKTVDLLASRLGKSFNDQLTSYGESCIHFAAEFGQAQLLKHLLTRYPHKDYPNLDPCGKTKIGYCPLHLSTTTGTWDCFWILLPYYRTHEERKTILDSAPFAAVGQNRMDFFKQYVNRLGDSCVQAKSACGKPLSFELLSSRNMITARILINDYKMNLTATDAEGRTALTYMAKIALERKIDPLWIFISELVEEFNPLYNNQLHLMPQEGISLQHLINTAGKNNLFPCLNQSNSQSHLFTTMIDTSKRK
jgi:hypothetical protein